MTTSPWVHVGLDLAGFIPGYGEAADFANIVLYLKDGKNLDALLSAISLMVGVGDLIAKPIRAYLALNKKVPYWIWQMLLKHSDTIRKAIRQLTFTLKVDAALTSTFEALLNGPLKDEVFEPATHTASRLTDLVKKANYWDSIGRYDDANVLDLAISLAARRASRS
jgi:hypothetical protein